MTVLGAGLRARRGGERSDARHGPGSAAGRFDFYGEHYARFGTDLAAALCREVFGDDVGQTGWRTAAEQAEIADLLRLGPDVHALDIACGSGGPSLALAGRTGCRVTGLDVEPSGVAQAQAVAAARGLAGRAEFRVAGCGGRLPFADGSFEAVLCVDAVNHLPDRFGTVREWARLLRPGGRLLFTGPVVVTGAVAKAELDAGADLGFYLFVPPGLDEEAIAARWHAARARHAPELEREEGATGSRGASASSRPRRPWRRAAASRASSISPRSRPRAGGALGPGAP